jgi:hypothetical protein
VDRKFFEKLNSITARKGKRRPEMAKSTKKTTRPRAAPASPPPVGGDEAVMEQVGKDIAEALMGHLDPKIAEAKAAADKAAADVAALGTRVEKLEAPRPLFPPALAQALLRGVKGGLK